MRLWQSVFLLTAGLTYAGSASAASLNASPSSITFFGIAGGGCSGCSTSVDVTASSGSLNFSARASTTSGGNWLSVSPTQAATEASLTVSANSGGLSAGTYSGSVILSCDAGSSCASFVIGVTLNVSGLDTLTVIPNPVSITETAGQSSTTNVTLTGVGGNVTVSATVVTNSSWLRASVISQSTLSLLVDATGLTPGNLVGDVQLQCSGAAQCQPYTAAVNLTVNASATAPVISGLSPASATAGGAAFTLTVNGTGFTNSSTVQWNGSGVATTFVSATQLTASIPANLIVSPGSETITVVNAGGTSNPVTFNVSAAAPVITSISPSAAAAGSPSLTVTITGSGFVSGSSAQWNGLSLSTSFVSATTLSAQITASDLLSPGTGQVTVKSPSGAVSNSVPFLVSSSSARQLLTVAPCRVLDTRTPANDGIFPVNSTFGSPFIAAGTVRTIPIPASACGVPTNAAAYSLNFTVQPRTPNPGALTVWPAGIAQPNVSTVNFSNPAVVLAAAGIVPGGTGGAISAAATQDIDLIIDINGYFVPPGAGTLQFYTLPPCRVLDTRTPANAGTFPPNSTFGSPSLDGVHARSFPIPASSCGAPASAAAFSFNVGVVPQGALYFLAAYPTGGTLPIVSTMNSFDGTILANAAIVPAGPGGGVNFFGSNPSDFFVDINGYFAPPGPGGLNFYTLSPCRLVDTRNPSGTFGGPTMAADAIRSFPLPESPCGIPSGQAVQAYSLSITVYPTAGPLSYLTTWPAGGAQPFVSTLNAFKGQPIANAALVPAGAGGGINVFVTNPADVTIDTAGYFGP